MIGDPTSRGHRKQLSLLQRKACITLRSNNCFTVPTDFSLLRKSFGACELGHQNYSEGIKQVKSVL